MRHPEKTSGLVVSSRLLWGLLAAGILGYILFHAFVVRDVAFLRPPISGTWIVRSNPPVETRDPDRLQAEFVRTLHLEEPPVALRARVTALRDFDLYVNGRPVDVECPGNWKRGVRVDLGPLLRAGRNEVRVRVRGGEGPPALLVEGPREIRSGQGWVVTEPPSLDDGTSAPQARRDEAYLQGKVSPLVASRRFAVPLLLGFLAYAAFVGVLTFRAWKMPSPSEDGGNPLPTRARPLIERTELAAVLGILAVVGTVQVWNAFAYPYDRSPFDLAAHVEHIQHVAAHWTVADATEGPEMFQPPLYYFAAAAVYSAFGGLAGEPGSLKAIQLFGTFVGLLHLLVVWGVLRLLLPTRSRARILGFALAAFLPMTFYMNPLITNEVFAAAIIGAAILVAVRVLQRPRIRTRDAVLVGIASGLALLSKYTGLFVAVAALLLLTLRWLAGRAHWKIPSIAGAVTLLLSGWFYVGHFMNYGDPFVGNWDEALGFEFQQRPGYRTAGSYLSLGPALFHTPEWSRWAGVTEGKYVSMWADSHGAFLQTLDWWTDIWQGLLLWGALLPTAAILLGAGIALRRILNGEWYQDHAFSLLLLTSVLTVGAAVIFTLQLPFYSTVKAFFLLSLLSAFATFGAIGLERMIHVAGRGKWLVYGNLLAVMALAVLLFRYPGT